MAEKLRTCILCGNREVMTGYICSFCQEKIQKEATGKRREMLEEARMALKRNGINPDDNK